ncbi:hypothetical protein GCM10009850_087780 [Nonomuraea monospora]|uniref:Uncharacterized protein n=1 Tax=Nonomuraea monospora TaxID=568818 RepID=A0ABN3CV34_9ACTN
MARHVAHPKLALVSGEHLVALHLQQRWHRAASGRRRVLVAGTARSTLRPRLRSGRAMVGSRDGQRRSLRELVERMRLIDALSVPVRVDACGAADLVCFCDLAVRGTGVVG